MKLIIDSGGTKAEWCLEDKGKALLSFRTDGINFATGDLSITGKIVSEAVSNIGDTSLVEQVHFYAAGLIIPEDGTLPESVARLDDLLKARFPEAEVFYASDLLGAARAVCGHRKGIACIIGTGSNTCLYDGRKIVRNIHSCGFILGDEGSGACLGKRFMGDFLKDRVPEEVAKDFASRFDTSYPEVVRNVYRSPAPARYLGSFAPYILSWYGRSPYVTDLVENNFRDLIRMFVKEYGNVGCEVGSVGGFGYACRDILRKVAEDEGITFGKILDAPMEGLIAFHS
jgi:N-acetylglucosamine kinase-like BadF-type ATPase